MTILDKELNNGVVSTTKYDAAEDRIIVEHTQDAQAILDHNKDLRNNPHLLNNSALHDGNALQHYAQIPLTVVLKWQIEDGIDVTNKDHMPRVLQKLASPEYAYLRVTDKIHRIKDR